MKTQGSNPERKGGGKRKRISGHGEGRKDAPRPYRGKGDKQEDREKERSGGRNYKGRDEGRNANNENQPKGRPYKDDKKDWKKEERGGGKSNYKGSDKRDGSDSDRPKGRPYRDDKKDWKKEERGHGKPFSGKDKKREYRDGDRKAGKQEFRKNDKSGRTYSKDSEHSDMAPVGSGLIRLNKYIADAGICSRREADTLIASGVIQVNGKIVTELGTKVSPHDTVHYGGDKLSREKLRYVVLNKPKGFITTMDDPFERKTVMSLISRACTERIYPVGRLDRNTTGVLLFSNDGELAKKLTHPKHNIRKVYHVVLNKPVSKPDLISIVEGIELEDGIIKADAAAYVGDGTDKKEIGIELHSGRNRIVRRIFETLEYEVVKLDRVSFAGITKKDVPRGKWRHLSQDEINILKRL